MPFKKILVPVDFSESSERALRQAVHLARHEGAEITLMHVGMLPHVAATTYGMGATATNLLLEAGLAAAAQQAHQLETMARHEVPSSLTHNKIVREGFPPQEVLDEVAESGHDLVVMGTHGRKGLKRMFLGSVAERVVRECPVPVMVIP